MDYRREDPPPSLPLARPIACFPLLRGAVMLSAFSQPASEIHTPPVDDLVVAAHSSGDQLVEQCINGHWRRATLQVGDLTVLPPGIGSRWRLHGSCTFVHVAYSASRLEDVCRRIGWRGPIKLEPLFGQRDESMGRLVLGAWGQLQARRPLCRATAELAVQLILAMLLQTYAVERGGIAPAVMSGAVRATINRIETQLDGDLRLAALASAARVSPSSLAKSFRATMGMSLHQYVLQRRIERAQTLLRSTQMPVTEIAGLTGFGNSQHFSTAFRRAVGATPSEYRQRKG